MAKLNPHGVSLFIIGVTIGALGASFYFGYKAVNRVKDCRELSGITESFLASNNRAQRRSGEAMATAMIVKGESDGPRLLGASYACRQDLTSDQFKTIGIAAQKLIDFSKEPSNGS